MNTNESKSLWISLGAGLFAAFLLYSYSQERQAEYLKKYGTKKNVVVAKFDIQEMQTINDDMLIVDQQPSDFIQPGAISEPELAVGQVAAAPFKKGEQLLQTKLLQPGPDTGIALQVAPSKRAVTLPVDEVRGIAKLIRPGDRVDIYAAVDSGRGINQRREVQSLLQDVVVLATGVNVVNNLPRRIEADGKNVNQVNLSGDTSYGTITIEVTPKEAQDLIYIHSTSPGNIYFTLRNPNDRAVPPRVPSSTAESVLGKPEVSLAPAAVSAPVQPVAPPVPQRQQPPPKKGGFRDF